MFQNNVNKMRLLYVSLILVFISRCAHLHYLKESDRDYFYNYSRLSSELSELQELFPALIRLQTIGTTYEGRAIYVIRITKNKLNKTNKPGFLAIFAEHSAEHEGTILSMGLTRYLVENYGKDEKVTNILNEKEVYILPMMNPDGVEYNLSDKAKSFTWHKNRRSTGKETYGVNLNRNWGHKWNASVPEKLAKNLKNKKSGVYAGEGPFSEKETQSVRDFLLAHPNIKIFVDYHSGFAPFMQGGVGFPIPRSEDEDLPPEHRKRYEEIAERFAKEMNNSKDARPGFVVAKERDVAKIIRKYAPWYIKPFIPKSIPPPPGTSGEWVYGELGIMVFGVESFRTKDFLKKLPKSKEELVENHQRGFLFLLDILSKNPFE